MVLKFKITVKDESATIIKSILIPKIDYNKYYTIRGKKYFLLYQLVDNSTYTAKAGLTFKSGMPICVNKNLDKMVDVEGKEITCPYYFINTFKREFEAFLFYFSRFGFSKTMRIFTVDEIVRILPNDGSYTHNDEEYIYFILNKNLVLRVVRRFYEKYMYVQSICLMIKRTFNNRTTMENLEDSYYWTQRIGTSYTLVSYKLFENGRSTIAFFERLLDRTSQKMLKVSKLHKKDVYTVVAWIIKNFVELKKKDNLDLENKRLRLYEYVAAILNKRVSEGINRILTLGSKIKMKQVRDVFKFPGTIIFQLLYTASLLKYDDRVNDLDAFSALRYSVRGPNSLGSRSDRNISIKYRACHPSYIGRLDLCTCSASSPGLSGAISPFAKTEKLWFNAENEPENKDFEIYKQICEYNDEKYKDSNIYRVEYRHDDPKAYYEGRYNTEQLRDSARVITKYSDPAFNEEGIYCVQLMEEEVVIEL